MPRPYTPPDHYAQYAKRVAQLEAFRAYKAALLGKQ